MHVGESGHVFTCLDVETSSEPCKASPSPRTLDAFHRMELEVFWRKLEDSFVAREDEGISRWRESASAEAEKGPLERPFSMMDEYRRLGISLLRDRDIPEASFDQQLFSGTDDSDHLSDLQAKWRISTANQHYELCPSYPQLLAVPRAISDEHLGCSSKQRSSRRIPTLTWVHPNNGAALCRFFAEYTSVMYCVLS